MKTAANIINSALHPIVLTIPAVYLLTYVSTGSMNTSLQWTLYSMLFSGIISLFVLFGVKKGFFNNIDVSNKRQRIILYPFAILVIFFFSLFVVFFSGPRQLADAGIFFIISLVILDVVNSKIKASIHVAAVSAFVTGAVFVYQGYSYLLFFLVPLVAWARITQKRHTLSETIVGAVLGIFLTAASIFIVQSII